MRADTGHMADSTLWVAVLTGGTALGTSWVTSRGNARAARVQAVRDAAAEANSALGMLAQGQDGATERFDQAHRAFRIELEGFIEAARTARARPPSSCSPGPGPPSAGRSASASTPSVPGLPDDIAAAITLLATDDGLRLGRKPMFFVWIMAEVVSFM